MNAPYRYSIFTKPYKTLSMDELGQKVSRMGFTAIEYPLREGYQVDLSDAENGMAELAKILKKYGVAVSSVAISLWAATGSPITQK